MEQIGLRPLLELLTQQASNKLCLNTAPEKVIDSDGGIRIGVDFSLASRL